jgi:hypothetical protein
MVCESIPLLGHLELVREAANDHVLLCKNLAELT